VPFLLYRFVILVLLLFATISVFTAGILNDVQCELEMKIGVRDYGFNQ